VFIDIAEINDGILAVDDTYETNENETLLGNASENDIDIDGDILTYSITDSTSNGELILNEDGSFTYIPNPGFFGTDFFQYEVCDPELCDTAIVLINVIELNTLPTVVADSFTMNEDDLLNGDVSTNDFDADGDVLTYSPAGTIETTNGTVILNEDGTFTYTPDPDFFGTDTFEYTACDDNGNCSTVVVTITVLPVDDPLLSAENDQYTVFENETLDGDVSENDVNLNGFTFSVTSTVTNGTLIFNADGTFTYVPNAENDGFDEFTYEACDDLGNCYSATVTIIIVDVDGDTVTVAAGFSPNGDNVNETLAIENIEAYPLKPEIIENTGYQNYISTDLWDSFTSQYEVAQQKNTLIYKHCSLKIEYVKMLDFNSDELFDVIYFDAFAAVHQPDMWNQVSLAHIAKFLNPGGVFVTYAITGDLKRSMKSLGFAIEKVPGAPGKREMLRAVKM
jgi:hypothetical protein